MTLAQSIAKNRHEITDTLYLVILQGLNYAVPLLVFPYLMKTLGADKFGRISFALSVCQYLILLVDFGFNLSATKQIALAKDNKAEISRIFSSTLYAKIGLLVVSFALLFLVCLIPEFAIYRKPTIIMSAMVIANAFSFLWLFQGLGKIRWVSIINTLAKVLILPLTFVFVLEPDDFVIAALIQSSAYVVSSAVTVAVIYRQHWVNLLRFDKQEVWFQIKDSFPIFLSIAATSVYTACFIIVLGFFCQPEEVGVYGAVEKLMRAGTYIVLAPVLQAFYPKISYLAKTSATEALSLVNKILAFIVFGMAAVASVLFFGSGLAVRFLGDDYASADLLFKMFAIAPMLIGVGGVMSQLVLLAIGDESDKKRYRNVYILAGCVALTSVFALTPKLCSTGAALSLLLTEFVVFALMTFFGIRLINKKRKL